MNVYLRIGLAAIGAAYISPVIVNKFTRVEMTELDGTVNAAMAVGVTGAVTAFVFTALSMAFGGPVASAAGGGGAT